MNNGAYHTNVNIKCHNKNVMKMKYNYYGLWYIKNITIIIIKYWNVKKKCIWKIFFKYTQICQSNTNTNTSISSCGFSNTNTNTNTDICVFKYKYKYVFDPSPAWWRIHYNNNKYRYRTYVCNADVCWAIIVLTMASGATFTNMV